MLEIRYNKDTGVVTGWWGSRWGNEKVKLKNRPDEVIVMVDADIPKDGLESVLYDKKKKVLVSNPAFVLIEPVTLEDRVNILEAEMAVIKEE